MKKIVALVALLLCAALLGGCIETARKTETYGEMRQPSTKYVSMDVVDDTQKENITQNNKYKYVWNADWDRLDEDELDDEDDWDDADTDQIYDDTWD